MAFGGEKVEKRLANFVGAGVATQFNRHFL
jgi:hypothetical protein